MGKKKSARKGPPFKGAYPLPDGRWAVEGSRGGKFHIRGILKKDIDVDALAKLAINVARTLRSKS